MENENQVQELQKRISQLEKINQVLMTRVEKSILVHGGAFSLFEKNSLLQAEVEKKTSLLQASVEELTKKDRAINGALLISETDVNGKITYANEKFCELSGFSRDELIGANHSIVNSSYHSKEFWADFWQTLKSGKPFQGEICNKKKDGELYWVSTSIYPNRDQSDALLGFTSVRFDITEKKINQAKNQHREKLAAIGELASGVGHEIKNPLAISVGNAAILKKLLNSENFDLVKANKYLDKIAQANRRIESIVNGLRVFSRSDSETYEDVSVRLAILQTLDLMQEIYKSEGIKIELNIC